MSSHGPDSNETARIKRERYRTSQFGEGYDRRYHGGLNTANTLVERKWIAARVPEGPVLDAGAGTGRMGLHLDSPGRDVLALDSSLPMLESIREKSPGLSLLCSEIRSLPFPDHTFPAVTCMHVLFHFPDWPVILKELARVTARGGSVFFEMRSGEHTSAASRVLRLLGRKAPEKENLDSQSATVHSTAAEVKSACEAAGLSIAGSLEYDLGHSHYMAFLSRPLESLLSASALARGAVARTELALGGILPRWSTYRTLYRGIKQ